MATKLARPPTRIRTGGSRIAPPAGQEMKLWTDYEFRHHFGIV
jgi:hypothetical protein